MKRKSHFKLSVCNFPYQSVGVSLFMALALALPTAAALASFFPIIHENWQQQRANKKNICNYTIIVLFFPVVSALKSV